MRRCGGGGGPVCYRRSFVKHPKTVEKHDRNLEKHNER